MKRTAVNVLSMLIVFILAMLMVSENAFAIKSFKGKDVLIQGDSIQASGGKFMERAIKSMGGRVTNGARNGATLGRRRDKNKNTVCDRILKMKKGRIRKYEYIVIAAGTNDFGNFVTRGKINRGEASSKSTYTTIGALKAIIRKIKKNSPKTKIIIVTPIYKYAGWDDDNPGQRVRMNCDYRVNRFGYDLRDYRTGIEKVARDNKHKGVYLIYGNYISEKKHKYGVSRSIEMNNNDTDEPIYTNDYTHPNERYSKILKKRAVKALKAL